MPTIREVEAERSTALAASSERSAGEDAAPVPSHTSTHVPRDVRTIPGWGADLDGANRPSPSMELPSTVRSLRGEVKHWQKPEHRIHVSNEHPNLTPVFGTSCPPRGLSGRLRDYAYEYGEATNRHWMTLLMADRVDVVEHGVASAMRSGAGALRRREESANDRTRVISGVLGVGVAALGLALLMRRRS